MNNECSIVKDLLPLYAEHLTSEDTAAFVKTHLETCESCRAALSGIAAPEALPADADPAAPMKAIKKKLTRRRVLIAAAAILGTLIIVFGAIILFDSRPVTEIYHDWSSSSIYPDDQIAAAGEALEKNFETMKGCKLYSYTYAGDEKSQENLTYINEFGQYDQCIVFESVFRSPLFGGGGWNAHEIYTWTWYLGRVSGGEWEVVQAGY